MRTHRTYGLSAQHYRAVAYQALSGMLETKEVLVTVGAGFISMPSFVIGMETKPKNELPYFIIHLIL